jgi:hypothetical protein
MQPGDAATKYAATNYAATKYVYFVWRHSTGPAPPLFCLPAPNSVFSFSHISRQVDFADQVRVRGSGGVSIVVSEKGGLQRFQPTSRLPERPRAPPVAISLAIVA